MQSVSSFSSIEKVMKNQPAVFLKLLVLLVPKEMQIEPKGGVKAMTEDRIVDAIAAIEGYLARRSGEASKVIEGTAEPAALPAPARKTKRKRRKSDVGLAVGSEEEGANS